MRAMKRNYSQRRKPFYYVFAMFRGRSPLAGAVINAFSHWALDGERLSRRSLAEADCALNINY
jgi:hypothetical protein